MFKQIKLDLFFVHYDVKLPFSAFEFDIFLLRDIFLSFLSVAVCLWIKWNDWITSKITFLIQNYLIKTSFSLSNFTGGDSLLLILFINNNGPILGSFFWIISGALIKEIVWFGFLVIKLIQIYLPYNSFVSIQNYWWCIN
jgi:hypothetical protein